MFKKRNTFSLQNSSYGKLPLNLKIKCKNDLLCSFYDVSKIKHIPKKKKVMGIKKI